MIYHILINHEKFNISVDFGQQSKLFSNEALVDEKGRAISFNSMVDAMNYMSKHGWEFDTCFFEQYAQISLSALLGREGASFLEQCTVENIPPIG